MPRTTTILLATAASLALVAIIVTGCAQGRNDQTPPEETSPGDETSAEGLTVGTTEGPYYVSSTAELRDGDLNYTDLEGEPIRISGYVYGGAGNDDPLVEAKVEIWHADSEGEYHPSGSGDATDYEAGQLALRGFVITDPTGYYEFTSIYPGFYPGRTRHIHVRASAEGYGGVVTQIIVPPKSGDEITPETDLIAQSLPAANDVELTQEGDAQVGTFNFHLGAD